MRGACDPAAPGSQARSGGPDIAGDLPSNLNPGGITPAAGPDDLPRYFREIHANALASPLSRALATSSGEVWQTVRQSRRAKRLDAISAAVEAVGAPAQATAEATAMVLRLSGADASWPLHDSYGLPLDRVPDVIAHAVDLIIRDLRTHLTCDEMKALSIKTFMPNGLWLTLRIKHPRPGASPLTRVIGEDAAGFDVRSHRTHRRTRGRPVAPVQHTGRYLAGRGCPPAR
jgi:hypothetical protein